MYLWVGLESQVSCSLCGRHQVAIKMFNIVNNRAKGINSQKSAEDQENDLHSSITFAELITFVEEVLSDKKNPILKLVDLVKIYSKRQDQLEAQQRERMHSTLLKDKLLPHIPALQAHKKGRDVLLVLDTTVGKILSDTFDETAEREMIFVWPKQLRYYVGMFDHFPCFEGSFLSDCREKSVPAVLIAFMLMLHNCIKHKRRNSSTTTVRHCQNQETPFPLYTGMMIHARTRNRGIIDKLFQHRICLSYDRVLQLSIDLANAVCEEYKKSQIVIPTNLKTCVFITGAVDNINHNPSSYSATDSFHGTGISLFQHSDFDEQGIRVMNVNIKLVSSSKSIHLCQNSTHMYH
ncbi:hypothetical protein Hamer_G003220, partial [Homarus americanus]